VTLSDQRKTNYALVTRAEKSMLYFRPFDLGYFRSKVGYRSFSLRLDLASAGPFLYVCLAKIAFTSFTEECLIIDASRS